MAKATKKPATPKVANVKEVAVVEQVQEELYEIPQSLPIQERSRNAVRRALHKHLVEKKLNGPKSTPANPQSIAVTKAQMTEIEAFTAAQVEAHFANTEYAVTEIALAVAQLSEKQAAKCGGTITTEKLRKNTENFFSKKFAKPEHFPRK